MADQIDSVDSVEQAELSAQPTQAGGSGSVPFGANTMIYGPTTVEMIGPGAANGFTIKQGDTLPWLRAHLLDAAGSDVDLTGAEVRFHMRQIVNNVPAATLQVNGDCTLDEATDGKVSYHWQGADTAVAGVFSCDFRVIFPDGTALSFPNASEFTIKVEGSVALTAP